jgi:hypothetical protein
MLLRRKPFLDTISPIEHLAAEMRPRRPSTEHVPAVERAWVSPEFGGEFFFGKKF